MSVEERLLEIFRYGSLNKSIFCTADVVDEVREVVKSLGFPLSIAVPEHWQGKTDVIVGWDRDHERPDVAS